MLHQRPHDEVTPENTKLNNFCNFHSISKQNILIMLEKLETLILKLFSSLHVQ